MSSEVTVSKNGIFAFVIIVMFIFGGMFMLLTSGGEAKSKTDVAGVTTENGKQVIQITAKGGYTPAITNAAANTPTIVRVSTAGTFDCSSSLSFPTLGIRKNLPPNGTTDIEIPAQAAGTELVGTCSMGMYRFKVNFS